MHEIGALKVGDAHLRAPRRIGGQAHAHILPSEVYFKRRTIAQFDHAQLLAKAEAIALRVRELFIFERVEEQRRRRQQVRLELGVDEELVVLAHTAVTIGHGMRLEERSGQYEVHANAGHDHIGRGHLTQRIVAGVLYHHKQASAEHVGGERVGHARVEPQDETVVVAGRITETTRVRVEAKAAQIVRMKHEREVAGVARHALKCARDEDGVERAAEHELLLVGHERAARLVHIRLHSQVGQVVVVRLAVYQIGGFGRAQHVDAIVAPECVHLAEGDGGEDGHLFAKETRGRRHFVLAVLGESGRDEHGANAGTGEQQYRPNDRKRDMMRAQYVGQSVHFDKRGVLAYLSKAHVPLIIRLHFSLSFFELSFSKEFSSKCCQNFLT